MDLIDRLRMGDTGFSVQDVEGAKTICLDRYDENSRPDYPAVPVDNPVHMNRQLIKHDKSRSVGQIPQESGVYFVWRKIRGVYKVIYVGMSTNLRRRVSLSHDNILDDEYVTFLIFPKRKLLYAEAFYIGLCQPKRNFGKLTEEQ